MKYQSIMLLLTALTSVILQPALAQTSVSLGALINATGWQGDNGTGNSDFNSDKGGQFGLTASLRKDRLYLGISMQGGEYQFDKSGPTQFTSAGPITTNDVKVQHSDFDLLAGYYFWENVSLFLDIKTVSSTWQSDDYEQSFSGLGMGVAGFKPLNAQWTLYGSLGFVGGEIKQDGSGDLGKATSSALIAGFNYAVDRNNHLNMGLRSRNYLFDYDDGNEQEYSLNGLFFGYNHVFEL